MCNRGRVCLGTNFRLRSEEHTSELQSRLHLVCRLLLEKKKQRPAATWPTPSPADATGAARDAGRCAPAADFAPGGGCSLLAPPPGGSVLRRERREHADC